MRPNGPDPDSLTVGWVVAAQGGDAEAFGELHTHLAPALETWARLRVRGAGGVHLDPGDLVQEVWLRAWRQLEDFDSARVPFRPWLFRVAKNVLLEAHRQARRTRPGQAGPSTRMLALANLPDSVTAISRRVQRDENLALFQERIDALPEEDRDLVLHCGLEGLPHRDVAQRLGLTTEAVTKRWQRLRARLTENGLPETLLAAG